MKQKKDSGKNMEKEIYLPFFKFTVSDIHLISIFDPFLPSSLPYSLYFSFFILFSFLSSPQTLEHQKMIKRKMATNTTHPTPKKEYT